MLSYVLAVLAAFGNATSSVLQRKANRDVPRSQNLSWRLIWSLLHQPVWFGGILAICIGFVLQATALGFGELATVEPILVLELPLTLILAARIFGQALVSPLAGASRRRLSRGSSARLARDGLGDFARYPAAPGEFRSWAAGTGLALAELTRQLTRAGITRSG